jgi:hypothetical protein
VIGAIKEGLRGQLTSIASKLLSSEHTKWEDLSVEEQHLWNSFDNSDIYEFITGEPDTLPEFQLNWIEPCQLADIYLQGWFWFKVHLQRSLLLQRNLQFKRSLRLQHSLLLQHHLLLQHSLQLQHCQHRPRLHQFLDPVGFNNLSTPKTLGLASLKTTGSSTLASSRNAESYNAKQKRL